MWTYNNEQITSIEQAPEDAVGFIYLMTNVETGRKYIGKKYLYSERKVNLGKKEVALLANKRLKKWKTVKKESDWLSYNSSSDEIKAEIRAGVIFDKQIICWTSSKIETYYLEVKLQFQNNVLESDEWYNKNIASKWFKGNLK
jgi:hypothetical protein